MNFLKWEKIPYVKKKNEKKNVDDEKKNVDDEKKETSSTLCDDVKTKRM